jgi:predicted N-acyltransferase
MPVPTFSAHLIAHPGLSRAVEDFLARERAAMAEHMSELAKASPFRKEE